ncbi:MAG: hypothetical protein P4M08_01300 [Oligoflexia bacterium]|nr:hypothetical protein [Oligoflexia bacterium]
MAKHIVVDIKAAEKLMESGPRKIAGLPEDIALWLYWRKITDKRVPADIAAEVVPGIKAWMVTNFYTEWYGIGGKAAQKEITSFEKLYEFVNKKKSKSYPEIKFPGIASVEKMISACESMYGKAVSVELLKPKKKKSKKNS